MSSSYPSLTPNAVVTLLRTTDPMSTTTGGGGNINSYNRSSGSASSLVMQVLNIKPVSVGGMNVNNHSEADRYRIILSDGIHFVQCMMGSALMTFEHKEQYFKQNCIVQVHDYVPKCVAGRVVVILMKLSLLTNYDNTINNYRINNPIDIEKSTGIVDDLLDIAKKSTAVGLVNLHDNTTNNNPAATTSSSSTPFGGGPQPLYNSTNTAPMSSTSGGGGMHNSYEKPSNPYQSHSAGSSVPLTPVSSSNAPIVRSNMGVGSNSNNANITPISALNMYNNRWTIQARVTSKSEIRTWSNTRGEGSLFSIDLLDSSGTDIRGTFFKEAVDKFYHILTIGQIYTFSGGRLKVANLQYNTCKSNFEITFDSNTEIHLQQDTGHILQQTYDFVPIEQIANIDPNRTIDVIGIVKLVGATAKITSKKTGQELIKCDITLVDTSNTEINFTVWGQQAEKAPYELQNQPVIAIRRARVSDYGGRSLSSGNGGSLDINPVSLNETKVLQTWWNQFGKTNTTSSKSLSSSMGGSGKIAAVSERKDISCIKNDNLGYNVENKADWIAFKGTCTFIKKDKEGGAWYTACPTVGDPCRNLYRVSQSTDGQWYCEKCNNYYPNPVRRWIFSAVIEDPTGSTWVSFFNEQAEKLLCNKSADEAYSETYENPNSASESGFDVDTYNNIFFKGMFEEYIFNCKVKNEIIPEGESRMKTTVYTIHPIDYVKESVDILNELEKVM